MTKPDSVDPEAWDQAWSIVSDIQKSGIPAASGGWDPLDSVERIASAIMAAKAEERERAVHVVESHKVRCDLNTCHFASPSHECKYSDGFSEWRYDADIAAAIRNRP